MAADTSQETPFYLRGNYAPVTEEVTAFDLPVDGAVVEGDAAPELDVEIQGSAGAHR